MKMSEEVAELFKGMFTLKTKLKQPKFDTFVDYTTKKGQKIKFEYATLGAVEDAIRTAAQESKSGIDFQQEVVNNDGKLQISTLVTHSSGQYIIHGPFVFISNGSNPQDIGSLVTYAKRYALSAAFGIAADKDDDGKAAADIPVQKQQTPQKQNQQQPPQQISGRQLADLRDEARKAADVSGMEPDVFIDKLAEMANVQTIEELQAADFNAARAELIKWKQAYQKKLDEQNQTELFNSKKPPMATENNTIPWGQKQ